MLTAETPVISEFYIVTTAKSMDITRLRKTARLHIDRITKSNPTIRLPLESQSKNVNLQSLVSLVDSLKLQDPTEDRQKSFEDIIILRACISQFHNEVKQSSCRDAAILIRQWVANAILPSKAFAERSPYSAEGKPALTPDLIIKEHALSLQGLSLLSHLQKIVPLSSSESTVTLYTCLASFSDNSDSWTSPQAKAEAHSIAQNSMTPEQIPGVLHALLQERVKPLFATTKNPAITQQARRAIDPLPTKTTAHSDMDAEAKPWKYQDPYIVTVFQWVLKHLDPSTIEASWPLIIPPLLALTDDASIPYKTRGCTNLTLFLHTCPPPLLERTGLGEVFENTLMPCLMYLPSLTEEVESLPLLKAAYPALISLAQVRFADEKHTESKQRALNRILRHGVLKGYAHAGEHVRIAEHLVRQMGELVDEMGIASVRHLKHILPPLSANLAAPFATAYPPLLEASIKALETFLVNGWPRIRYHRGEILRGLITCWCRIKEEEAVSEELKKVRSSIERLVHLLTLMIKKDVDVAAEFQILIDCDDRLRDLLIV